MKRIIAAAAFAVLAVPVFAFAADRGAPYEQNVIDRKVPDVRNPVVAEQPSASAGATNRGSSGLATGAWVNDWNFIAPPM
jgi:hypothetical protein